MHNPEQSTLDLDEAQILGPPQRWVKIYEPLSGQFISKLEQWIFYDLVLRANWRPGPVILRKVRHFLQRGQAAIIVGDFAKAWGMSSRKPMRTILANLRTSERLQIGQARGHAATIITICNYDKYQSLKIAWGQARGQAGAKQGPTEQDSIEKKDSNQQSPTDSMSSPINGADVPDCLKMVSIWNDTAGEAGAQSAIAVPETMKKKLRARLKDTFNGSIDDWREFCLKVAASDFMTGKVPPSGARKRSWRAALKWVIEPSHYASTVNANFYPQGGRSRPDIDDVLGE